MSGADTEEVAVGDELRLTVEDSEADERTDAVREGDGEGLAE